MRINKLYKDVYEIENFVTEEENSLILNWCYSAEEKTWWGSDESTMEFNWWNGKQIEINQNPIFKSVINRVNTIFESLIGDTGWVLQRYRLGDNINPHRDYWKYELDYHIRYGIIIYYNDNYTGGEIEYPDLGITHKPKSRSLLMHGGNVLHGTIPVSEGVRYFSTSFIKGSKDVPVVLNKKLFNGIEEEDGSTYR